MAPPEVVALGQPPQHTHACGCMPGEIVVHSSVREHYVGEHYVDAGAVAVDAVDGDVSALISAAGLARVATGIPTLTNTPFLVQYSTQDRAGNQALPVARYVHVNYPDGSLACEFSGGGTYCSMSTTLCIETISPPPVMEGAALPVLSLMWARGKSMCFKEWPMVLAPKGFPRGCTAIEVPLITALWRGTSPGRSQHALMGSSSGSMACEAAESILQLERAS